MTTEHTPTLERIRFGCGSRIPEIRFSFRIAPAYCALGRDDDRRVLRVLQK